MGDAPGARRFGSSGFESTSVTVTGYSPSTRLGRARSAGSVSSGRQTRPGGQNPPVGPPGDLLRGGQNSRGGSGARHASPDDPGSPVREILHLVPLLRTKAPSRIEVMNLKNVEPIHIMLLGGVLLILGVLGMWVSRKTSAENLCESRGLRGGQVDVSGNTLCYDPRDPHRRLFPVAP